MSANQEQLNVVGFLSSFVTLVSLSHFSFVETCVYLGERRRVARPPLALARGAGVQRPHSHGRGGRGEASPGGRGRSTFQRGWFLSTALISYFSEVLPRSGRAAARSAQRLLAGGHCIRAIPTWVRPHDGATPGLRQGQRGPVRRSALFCADKLCPLIPVACRGRLPVP